ncbi:carnitine dehydratase [Bosea thiooxidans]|uniref:Carnitine dehydratase n=1 Tax=Bosea thiooxidans TaxID=53254 RepID=A0A0Q3L0F2_9HYPH|nr:CaiB/BaiF CoA-transferase family protein [Bosea thiooxidans]KQK30148.1 carnitine dehydratase [Bosea thiooxidans]SKC11539.1 Crotonobetainyl-CoA:carnitine CoA-transferase CaiB [Bosea thiooxidans]
MTVARGGPLAGVKVVEIAGIGPAPMAAMLLSDLGADVIIIDRLEPSGLGIEKPTRFDVTRRGRRSVALDLKRPEAIACALELIDQADALIEGFRPGTMERLGLGPEICLVRNPRLVYGRVTGWGQDGPLAKAAGHDLNYIALSGALSAIGRAGQAPSVPLNLIGDYGGGAMLLAFGIVCALLEAGRSGKGQVVDAAMVEGSATLMASLFGLAAAGIHRPERGTNLLDSGAPHYETYACADGGWIAIAPIEKKFRDDLLRRIGFDPAGFPDVDDRASWPHARELLRRRFAERSRAAWCEVLEGTDACFAPVLSLAEAPEHDQAKARASFVVIDGVVQPAPQPRFSRTPPAAPTAARAPGMGGRAALAEWGLPTALIDRLQAAGALRAAADIPEANGTAGAR